MDQGTQRVLAATSHTHCGHDKAESESWQRVTSPAVRHASRGASMRSWILKPLCTSSLYPIIVKVPRIHKCWSGMITASCGGHSTRSEFGSGMITASCSTRWMQDKAVYSQNIKQVPQRLQAARSSSHSTPIEQWSDFMERLHHPTPASLLGRFSTILKGILGFLKEVIRFSKDHINTLVTPSWD